MFPMIAVIIYVFGIVFADFWWYFLSLDMYTRLSFIERKPSASPNLKDLREKTQNPKSFWNRSRICASCSLESSMKHFKDLNQIKTNENQWRLWSFYIVINFHLFWFDSNLRSNCFIELSILDRFKKKLDFVFFALGLSNFGWGAWFSFVEGQSNCAEMILILSIKNSSLSFFRSLSKYSNLESKTYVTVWFRRPYHNDSKTNTWYSSIDIDYMSTRKEGVKN